jgi:sugar phosphate isomerase/epimerase
LHIAAQIGCDGVQIDAREELRPRELSDTGIRQLRKMLDDLNLRVGSIAFASRHGYADPQNLERRLEATVDAMRLAGRLGARVLVFTLGQLPLPEAGNRSTLVEALTSLTGQASRLGVELAAQCPEAGPEEVAALIDQLPAGLMGVDLNPGDLIRAGRQPQAWVESLGPHIAHVFANDAVRGFGGAAALEVELGRGSADMSALLGALEEFDYRGWVTVERRNSAQVVGECANAVAYLRAI